MALADSKIPFQPVEEAVARYTPSLQGFGLLVDVNHLRSVSLVNLVLAILSVLYLAVNVVCIVLNGYDKEDDEDPVISYRAFHLLEFWATFFFNIVQVVGLLYTPKKLSDMYASPTFLKVVIFVNVGVTFISALLITINTEVFENPSHELEYSNEVTMSLVDLVFLVSLIRNASGDPERKKTDFLPSVFVVLASMAIAIIQLGIFNLMGWKNGESQGETLSHYFEFVFEAISASITFWFVMDNRFLAETYIDRIMSDVGGRHHLLDTPRARVSTDNTDSSDDDGRS